MAAGDKDIKKIDLLKQKSVSGKKDERRRQRNKQTVLATQRFSSPTQRL